MTSNRCGTLHGHGRALARVGDRMGTLLHVYSVHVCSKSDNANTKATRTFQLLQREMAAIEGRPALSQGFKGFWLRLHAAPQRSISIPLYHG